MATFDSGLQNNNENMRHRVMHVITGLGTGGAEGMLFKLLSFMDHRCFLPVVVSLIDEGTVGASLRALNIPLHSLGIRRNIPNPLALLRLLGLIRGLRPTLIQGWMYHGNLAATLANRVRGGQIPVVWNIRQSLYDLARERLFTRGVIKLSARLSSNPRAILYNSRTSAAQHETSGFAADRTQVIPNGFDLTQFRPDKEAGQSVRYELDIDQAAVVVGLIARYHPMKGHRNFLRAAAVLSRDPRVHFLLAGTGILIDNHELRRAIGELGLTDRVRLLGERPDVPKLLSSLDVLCSASVWGEGFPNIVGEAMACGVPCVVTDVGDSADIVGDTGKVVARDDVQALAEGMAALISMDSESRRRLGEAARQRIASRFSIQRVARQYEALYTEILSGVRNRRAV